MSSECTLDLYIPAKSGKHPKLKAAKASFTKERGWQFRFYTKPAQLKTSVEEWDTTVQFTVADFRIHHSRTRIRLLNKSLFPHDRVRAVAVEAMLTYKHGKVTKPMSEDMLYILE